MNMTYTCRDCGIDHKMPEKMAPPFRCPDCEVRHMAADKAPVERLADNTERTWWLGTDVLPAQDQRAMLADLQRAGARIVAINSDDGEQPDTDPLLLSFAHGYEFGAIYNLALVLGDTGDSVAALQLGYSNRFLAIMQEARRRGYAWVAFDRDIRTKLKQRTDPPSDEGNPHLGDTPCLSSKSAYTAISMVITM